MFIRSKSITRIYYVLTGTGLFIIDGQNYNVEPGMLVEVPPNVEYCYSGRMKLFVVGHPRWSKGDDEVTKKNPDVFPQSLGRLAAKLGLWNK